jgi:hypothetical protein
MPKRPSPADLIEQHNAKKPKQKLKKIYNECKKCRGKGFTVAIGSGELISYNYNNTTYHYKRCDCKPITPDRETLQDRVGINF